MSEQSQKTKFPIRVFELACLAIIVFAGVIAVQRMIGQSSAIADQAVQNAVDRAEEVITDKVDQRVDGLLDEGFDLARDVLRQETDDDLTIDSSSIESKPIDRIDRLFRSGTRLFGKVTDEVMGLSPQEEVKIGAKVHEIVRSQNRIVDDPVELARIQQLAKPFLDQLDRQEMTYRFYLIDDDAINAFAHVGGYVYVNRGLLEAAGDDEHAVQFVIGHEIAHSDLRHCAASMTATVRADEVLPGSGSLAALAYRAISLGYSEDQELESDLRSYRVMVESGKSHSQAMKGLEMLKREFGADAQSDSGTQKSPLDYVDAHFRTHPPIQLRIQQLEKEQRAGR